MAIELDPDQWAVIDDLILRGGTIGAIKHIMTGCGIGLIDARPILFERYALLRRTRPDEFALTERDYWSESYS